MEAEDEAAAEEEKEEEEEELRWEEEEAGAEEEEEVRRGDEEAGLGAGSRIVCFAGPVNATNAPPRTSRCRTRNTNRVSSLKRHRARLGIEDGQALVKKLKDGKVNKPEPAVLVIIKKSIEASRRAVLSFVELMTSPLFGGAFVEKDGKLVVVQKASLMSKSKLSFYPSAVTWVMECLASGHELVTLAA